MKKLAFICLALLGACSQNEKSKSQHVIDTSQAMPYVFVISSASGSSSDQMLSLKAVPVVVYFSDRPHLVAGHLTLSDFIASWKNTNGKMGDDSPDAVLSILTNGKASEMNVELSEPILDGNTLKLKVKTTNGQIPATFGPSSLFIEMKKLDPSKTVAEAERF